MMQQTSARSCGTAPSQSLALRMVDDPALSVGEVAFVLGFSEASAFHRAFRRWTGRTPRPPRRA